MTRAAVLLELCVVLNAAEVGHATKAKLVMLMSSAAVVHHAGPLFSQLTALRSFIRELRPQLGSAGTTAALTACDELQALGQLLMDWGVGRDQLLLEPLLTPQAEYFSGTLFQVRH